MYTIKKPLVLASSSPRRRELLAQMGLTFNVVASDLNEDEHLDKDLSPALMTQQCARAKAQAVADRLGNEVERWFIGMDTVVVIDNEVLGKPADKNQAREYLKKLAGRWHKVFSGYCLINPVTDQILQGVVESEVFIKELSESEIESYIELPEPYDKAGAYAVQGVGASLVKAINGSYTNVVGCPLCELIEDLCRLCVIEPAVRAIPK